MPVDVIEMYWGCLACRGENLGRFKACQSCGSPRTEQSPEWMPGDTSSRAAVQDPRLLQSFQAGADWRCRYCGSSQFRAHGVCAQCGAGQAQAQAPTPTPAHHASHWAQQPAAPRWAQQRPVDAFANFEPPAPKTAWSIMKEWARGHRRALVVVGVIGVALSVALFFLLRTKVVEAKVIATSWERVVHVERYKIWDREGWSADATAFDTRSLGQRVHHHDRVKVGSHTESYTERVSCGQECKTVKGSCRTTQRTCKSNKNGSATCSGGDTVCSPDRESCSTKYCDERRTRTVDDYENVPRYQEWYAWRVWDWGHQRDVRASGTSVSDVAWPTDAQIAVGESLATGEKERALSRGESFSATLAWDDERFEYKPESVEEFQRFGLGTKHELKVGISHGVELLRDGGGRSR